MNILIVGLGGVGGYYGGLLARKYYNHPEIRVNFLARGAHLDAIRTHGLQVTDGAETFIVHPHIATDSVSDLPTQDFILLCTKSYDLESTVAQIKPCIAPSTVLLPLLNGVEIAPIIRTLLPDNQVWEGCTYIVGRRTAPGCIASTGGVSDVYFGHQNTTTPLLLQVEQLMQDAGITAIFSPEILNIIWTKYFFISTTASLTSYFDVSFGALLTNPERKQTLLDMLSELLLVAKAEGLPAQQSWADGVIPWLERLPFHTTSSMHTDFTNCYHTEVENLTGTPIRLAAKHNIPVPTYQKVYATLRNKMDKYKAV